jgi:DNA helicase-2/ATP-dependent DNA helicase PcrA
MGDFSKAYQELNDEQKKAVDAIQGAVLVIAGPGTGKTQLLSLRVANILDKTDTSPENILCLTFTNKAANNMQLRLSHLIGSAGQRVMIKTFHSFAAEIMNLYPQFFWNGARLANVPDAVQLEIIADILSTLPLDNPLALKFAGQYTAVKDAQDGLKLSKEAGLTPDKLRTLINLNTSYIDEVEPELVDICSERLNYKKLDELAMRVEHLPEQKTDELTRPLASLSTVLLESFETAHSLDEGTNRTKNTSTWKSRWIQSVEGQKAMWKERERNDWWLKLADVYELYRNTLHERGYYDYSDMIIEVITQIEQNPSMRADIQERFQYVLIDEFQDTNAAQLRLAHLVADHEIAEGNPNIMAVGDDDQSIYKFNGAELSNMRDFRKSYHEAQRYVLTDNYRSSQGVLDFSAQLIEQAAERAFGKDDDVSKKLAAKNEPTTKGAIEHISYPTKEHQYYGLAKQIAKAKTKPGTIAVLARSHDSLRALAHALHQQNIPVRYEQQQSVLEQPMIVEISYICEVLTALADGDEITANKYLPLILGRPSWHIEPEKLWKLALKNRSQPQWIESLLASQDDNLENIGHWLLWLAQESRTIALPRMLEYIIGLKASEHLTSPLRHHFLEADTIDTPYLANISAIRKLLELAQEFCEQGEATVKDFLRLWHVSSNNNTTVSDESLFVTAVDAVELLTVHKAKGLEFDTIFIVDAMESIWRPSSKGRKPPANLPLRPSGDTFDDYIRLMFVAVTRAKHSIFIGSYYTTDTGTEAVPSAIIRDILPASRIPYDKADNPVAVLETALAWPRLEGSLEKELLRGILEDYTLSPSGFLDFLDVSKGGPHYFLEKHLLRLPEAQSTAAAFGSAMHKALEVAQQLTTDKQFEMTKMLIMYEQALAEQLLPTTEHDRYLVRGQQVINRLFSEFDLHLNQKGQAEVALRVHTQDVPLFGKLDRIDFDSSANELLITDYKTGKPLISFITRDMNLQLKAWRYRMQLSLYALMVQAAGIYKTNPAIRTQILFVEAETAKELTRTYTPEAAELERTKQLLTIVYQKIISLNLPDVRHYDQSFDGTKKFEDDLLSGTI